MGWIRSIKLLNMCLDLVTASKDRSVGVYRLGPPNHGVTECGELTWHLKLVLTCSPLRDLTSHLNKYSAVLTQKRYFLRETWQVAAIKSCQRCTIWIRLPMARSQIWMRGSIIHRAVSNLNVIKNFCLEHFYTVKMHKFVSLWMFVAL